MSALLIDAGNSRVKWAFVSHGRLGPQHVLAHESTQAHAGSPAWNRALQRWRAAARRRRDPLAAVLVVSVAGRRFDASLRRLCRQQLGLRAQFVSSGKDACGVRNGYRDAWRLGADRWVALLGARVLLPNRAVLIVDAGTALTLDLLGADGRHHGGVIVPGPQLMVQSLLRETSGIRRRAAGSGRAAWVGPVSRRLFARDTRTALQAGACHAATALIQRAHGQAVRLLHSEPVLVLTGGAAVQIRSLLQPPVRLRPDLVLRGLAALLAESASGAPSSD